MKITALVHFYVPWRRAGSETMLHTMLRRLVADGHDVTAVVTDCPEAPFISAVDGVNVVSVDRKHGARCLAASRPDVIVTHHDNTVPAIAEARKLAVPAVWLMHNDFPATRQLLGNKPDLVVFNTDWLRDAIAPKYQVRKSVVIHPPVHASEHRTTPGRHVTLVNLNAHKGANIFYALAERLPDVEFLGVIGGHGQQIIRRDLPNVEIVEHTSNMRGDVWARTSILLMPSIYESYGMAGVEAMASGIPVIANPTSGLKESLGWAGNFVARDDIDGWVREIGRLQDPYQWGVDSDAARGRSDELDPRADAELDAWAAAVRELAATKSDTAAGWRCGA